MSTSSAPTLSRRRVVSGSLGMAALLGVGSLTPAFDRDIDAAWEQVNAA